MRKSAKGGTWTCGHPGCTLPAAAAGGGTYCEAHGRYYDAEYPYEGVREFFRSLFRTYIPMIEDSRRLPPEVRAAARIGEPPNALLTCWVPRGAGWHRHDLVGAVPFGDDPPVALPEEDAPTRVARWEEWAAGHMAGWLGYPRPALGGPPRHYIALWADGGVLRTVASPGYPLIGGVADVRALEHDPDIWLPGPPPSARPIRRTSAAPAAGELDALMIGNSSLLPVVFKGLYNPARFQRPGNGVPPFYNEGERRVYVHTGDGFGMLTAEQEARAWDTVLKLNDDQVRAFIIALGMWFASTGGSYDGEKVRCHVNDVLAFMGIQPHNRAYRPDDKAKAARDVASLNSVWIMGPQLIYNRGKPREVNVRSRLLEVAYESGKDLLGQEDLHAFLVQPGDWIKPLLGDGMRWTAIVLREVLRIDPRQGVGLVAMRLGVYLAMQWRIRAGHGNYGQPWRVRTLLESAGVDLPSHHEQRKRLRGHVGQALDMLLAREVIGGWGYVPDAEAAAGLGLADWLEHGRVRIDPPPQVLAAYAAIAPAARGKQLAAGARAQGGRRRVDRSTPDA